MKKKSKSLGKVRANMELEFRNTKTGCGFRMLAYMSKWTVEDLRNNLSLPGLDIEMSAVAYPYKTIQKLTPKRRT